MTDKTLNQSHNPSAAGSLVECSLFTGLRLIWNKGFSRAICSCTCCIWEELLTEATLCHEKSKSLHVSPLSIFHCCRPYLQTNCICLKAVSRQLGLHTLHTLLDVSVKLHLVKTEVYFSFQRLGLTFQVTVNLLFSTVSIMWQMTYRDMSPSIAPRLHYISLFPLKQCLCLYWYIICDSLWEYFMFPMM